MKVFILLLALAAFTISAEEGEGNVFEQVQLEEPNRNTLSDEHIDMMQTLNDPNWDVQKNDNLKEGAISYTQEHFLEFCQLEEGWKWGEITYVGSQAVKGIKFHLMVDLVTPQGKKESYLMITWAHEYNKETKIYSYKFDNCESLIKKKAEL